MVARVDPESGATERAWTVREPDGRDWRVYQGALSHDERRLYVSYHGRDTTGVDWLELQGDAFRRCPPPARPDFGCLGGHGGFALLDEGRVLVATGSSVVLEVDPAGATARGHDTRLANTHLMEFALDRAGGRLYAVGSCGYAPGFSAVGLAAAGLPMTPTVPGEWRWQIPPTPPRVLAGGVCGERLALAAGGVLVVGKTARPVPAAHLGGALLFLDAGAGRPLRSVATPSEPVDVLVPEPGRP